MTVLDTSTAIRLINSDELHRTHYRSARDRGEEIALSTIALFELWYGVENSKRWEDNARILRAFLESISVVPFDSDDARAAGELRGTLVAKGTLIGPYDLLIAAHALRRGATLVTANTREFAKVPCLIWENWSAA